MFGDVGINWVRGLRDLEDNFDGEEDVPDTDMPASEVHYHPIVNGEFETLRRVRLIHTD